jgi:hypothetical protein
MHATQDQYELVKMFSGERRQLAQGLSELVDEIYKNEFSYAKKLAYFGEQFDKLSQVKGNHICSGTLKTMRNLYNQRAYQCKQVAETINNVITQKLK